MLSRIESAEYLNKRLPQKSAIVWQNYLIENARNRHAYKIKLIRKSGKTFYMERDLLAFARYFKLCDVKNGDEAQLALAEVLEMKSKEGGEIMRIGFGLRLNNTHAKRIEETDGFRDFEDGKRIRIFLETERDIAPHTYALSLEQAKQLNKQLTEELALL